MGRILPKGYTERAAEFFRIVAGVRRTRTFLDELEKSFAVRNTIRDFMLMIIVSPISEGSRVPELDDLLEASAARGLPLIMIPSRNLLADVVTTESYEEGAQVLFGARGEIMERCLVMLRGSLPRDYAPAAVETLTNVQPIAVEAANLFTGGHYIGAQAAATTVLDTLLAKALGSHLASLGYPKHGITKILNIIEKHSPSDPYRALALRLIVPPALRAFEGAESDMAHYNRHATIHRASPRQYTPENALISLMHMSAVFVLLSCVGPEGFPSTPA